MHLRLHGAKIRSVPPDENVVSLSPDHAMVKPVVLSRQAVASSSGFVFVGSKADGLVQIGSCSDPFATLAQMRRAHGSRSSIEYLGFIRAKRALEVERAAQMALAGPREPTEWIDCPPNVAFAATQGAARRLGVEMIPADVEGLKEDLRSAALVSATRASLRRSQRFHRSVIGAGVILGLLALALAVAIIFNALDVPMIVGPGAMGVMGLMVAALALGRQRSAA